MKALVFVIRLNSLYSIRVPFTWQSALIYPILPSSSVIGMLANALQRCRNDKHPLEYFDFIENEVLWAGSRLLTPCIIKSYITSAIVKWEDNLGGKFTNALGRQFAYSKKLQVAAIFKNRTLTNEVADALKTVALTCGDSESPISLDSEASNLNVSKINKEIVQTEYPIPFTENTEIIVDEENESNGQVYLMHERCKKTGNNFPLKSYMIPIKEENKNLKPSSLVVRISEEKAFEIEGIGNVILRES